MKACALEKIAKKRSVTVVRSDGGGDTSMELPINGKSLKNFIKEMKLRENKQKLALLASPFGIAIPTGHGHTVPDLSPDEKFKEAVRKHGRKEKARATKRNNLISLQADYAVNCRKFQLNNPHGLAARAEQTGSEAEASENEELVC